MYYLLEDRDFKKMFSCDKLFKSGLPYLFIANKKLWSTRSISTKTIFLNLKVLYCHGKIIF